MHGFLVVDDGLILVHLAGSVITRGSLWPCGPHFFTLPAQVGTEKK